MEQKVVEILKKALKKIDVKLEDKEILSLIETPKDLSNGEFSFPCFPIAKKLKQNPHQIALELRKEIHESQDEFESIQIVGPYINFYTNKIKQAMALIEKTNEQKDNFGKTDSNSKKLMIEFASPNTNKPLHLGHMRNMAIGESVSRICEFNGFKVIRVNLNNDRGIHICKSMAAYKKYGRNRKPTKTKKGDHLVGDFYVMFNDKSKKDTSLELESHHMLQRWEEGDKETIELWKTMNKWALDGFKETYEKFGVKFDKEYFESKIYKKGKEIILGGLKDKIFEKKEDGAISVNLEDKKLGEKVLLRSDGTSIYITQDIYLAKKKFEDFKIEKSIYVTGNEQEYHFKVLFEILKKLKLADEEKLKHLSYGMVNLPSGRMKSREGTVVDADNLIEELQKIVRKHIIKRTKLSKKQLEERSLKIALAAIKYFLLKVDIRKNMVFNPEESISFEGDTGPYLQYSYARASSILRKIKEEKEFIIPEELEDKEKELISQLANFEKIAREAYNAMNPALVANYSYKLCQTFNEFYHSCKVIGSEEERFRIELIKSFRQILKNSLHLLGIDVLEEM